MFGNAFQLIETLVRNRAPVRKGMARLLDFCNQVKPAPVWESLLRLDYENDVRRLTEWLRDDLLDLDPPPAQVNGLWFGLSNGLLRDGQPTYWLYLVAPAISHATNSGHRVCWRETLALASERTPCVDADLAL